jgi:Ca2+-binding RTX toxin-like protein
MATYQFSALSDGQAISFNPTADVLNFDQSAIAAADLRVTVSGTSTRIEVIAGPQAGKDITLLNTAQFQLATSNVTFVDGSRLLFGDNSTATGDDNGNTLTGGTGRDLIFTFGGSDTINIGTANHGNDFVDGGSGYDTLNFNGYVTTGLVVDFATGTATSSGGTVTFANIERFAAGSGNDIINGNAANQNIGAVAGNDTVWGAGGNDTLFGGTGTDTFVFREFGTANADLVGDFTSGADKILLDAKVMTALGSSGNFAAGDARFWAAAGATGGHDADDRIVYNTTTRQLFYDADGSGAGAAQLIATLQSGATLTAIDIVVEGGSAPSGQAINGTSADESLSGGTGNDTINGGGGNDTLTGGAGADRFVLAETPRNFDYDRINDFAVGTDKLVLDNSALVNLGAAGDFAPNDPRFRIIDPTVTFGAQDADDRVLYYFGEVYYDPDGNGVAPKRLIAWLPGEPNLSATDITVIGNGNPPTPQGTSGNDSLVGSHNPDTLDGGAGNDTIEGWDGDDLLIGGDGSDVLDGGLNGDRVLGGPGDDTLTSGGWFHDESTGVDTLDGGLGNDTYILGRDYGWWYYDVFVLENLVLQDAGGIDTIVALSGTWLLGPGFENLVVHNPTGEGPVFGTGNELDNVMTGDSDFWTGVYLDGGDGNDTLIGGSGRDWFFFAAGTGNIGNDSVVGGADEDGLDFSGARSAVHVDMRTGIAAGGGLNGSGSVTFSGIDTVWGSSFNDVLIAQDVAVDTRYGDVFGASFEGGSGNDTLLGGAVNDRLGGGDGEDEMRGGGDNDALWGDDGADWLEGGAGTDMLNGGGASDDFVFRDAPRADNEDFVADFVPGTDKILLDRAVHANLGAAGNFAAGDARFFAGPGAISGQTASHRVIYDTTSGTLYYDADGNGAGAAHPIATLQGAPGLSATDISAIGEPGSPPPGSSVVGTSGNDSLAGTEGIDTIDGLAGNDTLDGRGGDDVLLGRIGNDSLLGGAGNDKLEGGDGDDTLEGGDGIDTLDGGAGNDTYVVTPGDVLVDPGGVDHVRSTTSWTLEDGIENLTIEFTDPQTYGMGNALDNHLRGIGNGVSLLGGAGNDRLEGENGSFLQGEDGNDTLIGGRGYDHLFAGAGDDLIDDRLDDRVGSDGGNFAPGAGNDTVLGGAANDFIQFSSDYGVDSIDTGGGVDSISFEFATSGLVVDLTAGRASGGGSGGAGALTLIRVENVYGGVLNDRITGDSGANRLVGHSFFYHPPSHGQDGNDTLDGLAGNDTLQGGPGADQFVYSVAPGAANADLVLDFISGTDKIVLDGNAHSNIGASGNFAPGDARFFAGAGANSGQDASNRVIYNTSTGQLWYDADGSGSGSAQLVATLQGAGPMFTATDIVVINGGSSSNRVINGTSANDSLAGGAGHDTLNGLAGNDTLRGLDGDDWLDGGEGIDTLDGGLGNDTYIVTPGDIIVSDPGGIDTVVTGSSWNISSGAIENITMTGTSNVSVEGNNFANTIIGNDAPNYINARGGSDTLIGNGGNDTYNMSMGGTTSFGHDVIDGGAGFDTVEFATNARSGLVAVLMATDATNGSVTGGEIGGTGRTTIVSIERFIAGDFDDLVTGSDVANYVDARAGNDTVNGIAGNDTIIGGTGNDRLAGGTGVDSMTGGLGMDSFVFAEAGTANADRITDFVSASDKVALDDAGFANIGAGGNFAAGDGRFWAAAGATSGHDSNDRVIYNTSTGSLYYDADGSGAGAAQLIATFNGNPAIAATDITVI